MLPNVFGFGVSSAATDQYLRIITKRSPVLNSYRIFLVLSIILVLATFSLMQAQQPLETETARPLKTGRVEVQATFEYQTSKEGTERAAPLAFEFGLTDRLSLL